METTVKELPNSRARVEVEVDPADANTAYLSVSGYRNGDPGAHVFKTTNGGRTWTNVLARRTSAGAIDLVMDPADPNTLYAATWQLLYWRGQEPISGLNPDDNQTNIWKTTNGGDNWSLSLALAAAWPRDVAADGASRGEARFSGRSPRLRQTSERSSRETPG